MLVFEYDWVPGRQPNLVSSLPGQLEALCYFQGCHSHCHAWESYTPNCPLKLLKLRSAPSMSVFHCASTLLNGFGGFFSVYFDLSNTDIPRSARACTANLLAFRVESVDDPWSRTASNKLVMHEHAFSKMCSAWIPCHTFHAATAAVRFELWSVSEARCHFLSQKARSRAELSDVLSGRKKKRKVE